MAVLVAVVALAIALACGLALLAVMRETVLLRADVHALSQVITKPPDPEILGSPLPRPVRDIANPQGEFLVGDAAPRVTGFLSVACGNCLTLVEDIHSAAARNPELYRQVSFVLTAKPGQRSEVGALLERLPFAVLHDTDGTVARACDVRGTPMLVSWVPSDNDRVQDYVYGGSAQWVLDRTATAAAGTDAAGTGAAGASGTRAEAADARA